ncbi:MAG TPA: CBS domain-containing protein [Candidatus Dormibacteraeota bacterium]|nr:CBS domain-containing protein [Candidatus Dormibacteraeota bacterium]
MSRKLVERIFSPSPTISFLSPTTFRYPLPRMTTLPLSELLGATVYDPSGAATGRVREVTLAPQEDRNRIASFIVKTKSGNRILPYSAITTINSDIHTSTNPSDWPAANGAEGLFLLERDLLDQQVIDINGRKVVRVNDVELQIDAIIEAGVSHAVLRVQSVDIGARGAIRRLLRGLAPRAALRLLLHKIPPRTIPWSYVDLIETDPARRIKLKISNEGLATLHPADIADIVEDLAPNEREAVFRTLDEDVAAETLEELEPKVQKSVVESLDSERAADIVEEMDPDAAADLLGDLSQDRTEQILVEMEPQASQEMVELLEHREETAAGRMTTEFLALPVTATVENAIGVMRNFEGGVESVITIYLVDSHGTLVGAVPLVKIVLANPETPLLSLTQEPLVFTQKETSDNEVAEIFDKYNLVTLPVVDEHRKLVGVVTSDDVITMLRAKL